jgi:predicted transcriptional regulator
MIDHQSSTSAASSRPRSKYRSRHELYYSILSAVAKHPEGLGRTRIMYYAMLSSDQTKIYIPILMQNELLKVKENVGDSLVYVATQKAYDFLDLYERMEQQGNQAILKRRQE